MSEVDKPFEIPEHWEWTTFEEIGTWTGGGTPSKRKTSYWQGDVPWVSPKDMKRLEIDDTEDHVTETAIAESATKRVPSDSILFVTRSGILEHTLPTARAMVPVTINQDLKALVLTEDIDSQFLLYYTCAVERSILRQCSKHGTTVASLESGRLYRFPVPLPPLPEQHRIVAKIEELFSNLDAGQDELAVAENQLERYRLSVLQAAVEGRLTADWRRTHPPEPADELLERILEERRKQWEEDYRAKYEAKGKDMPRYWKKRYKQAEKPEVGSLSTLPDGWAWTSFDQLLSNMRNGYSKAPKAEKGVPILRISSVRPMSVDLDDVRYLDGKPEDFNKYLVKPGYLLFIRYNGNPQLVGACGRVPELDQAYAHPDKLIRGEVAAPDIVLTRYLEIALNIGPSRKHLQNRVRTTAGQAGISQGDLYSCPIPVPPTEEQKQIVAEVERLLSVADDAATTTKQEQTRADRLRQSILKQAFSGKLVSRQGDGEKRTSVGGQMALEL